MPCLAAKELKRGDSLVVQVRGHSHDVVEHAKREDRIEPLQDVLGTGLSNGKARVDQARRDGFNVSIRAETKGCEHAVDWVAVVGSALVGHGENVFDLAARRKNFRRIERRSLVISVTCLVQREHLRMRFSLSRGREATALGDAARALTVASANLSTCGRGWI